MPIAIDRVHPHPANRPLSDSDCRDLADSIRAEGQLQAIQVRSVGPHWGLPSDAYQIVFGERRWRACRLAGRETIEVVIVELSDSDALRVMAVENAERRELNPIEQARAIERLCQSESEGGGGMTREQAGSIFGLKTGAAASNKVRLLQLPEKWQRRVISGELGESLARHLLPYCHVPPLMEAIDLEYSDESMPEWESSRWATREGFADQVEIVVEKNTRSLSADVQYWEANIGPVGCLFSEDELPADIREQLGIVELSIDGKPKRYATNCKLFSELQKAAWEENQKTQASEGDGKSSATAGGKSAKVLREQFAKRVSDWKLSWLRWHVAERMQPGDWQQLKFLAWCHWEFAGMHSRDALSLAMANWRIKIDYTKDFWRQFDQVSPILKINNRMVAQAKSGKAAEWRGMLSEYAKAVLVGPLDREPNFLPENVITGLCEDYELQLEELWRTEQTTGPGRERVLKFFGLHTMEQLGTLAEELGVSIDRAKTKRAALSLFEAAMTTRAIPLPAILAPARAAKSKTKRAKASKA